jgi:hypothetical protein
LIGCSSNLKHTVVGQWLNDYPQSSKDNYSGWINIKDGMKGMDEMAKSLAFLWA